MDWGTIQFDNIGIRHTSIWWYWNKAQFNLGPLEQGTIQFDGIGIRHNSNCDYGIGHKHYFGLCLIPPTPNELCLVPTYSVSFVPNSIHTIGPYSVCPSTVTQVQHPHPKFWGEPQHGRQSKVDFEAYFAKLKLLEIVWGVNFNSFQIHLVIWVKSNPATSAFEVIILK